MKFINIALLAICNIHLALSKALSGEDKCNDQFCYWVADDGSATILGFSENSQPTKILNIPSSVNFDGVDYYVKAAGVDAFSKDNTIEEVNVSSEIDDFYLDSNAFSECPNLKKVVFNNYSVSAADLTSFSEPNKDISFMGNGVKTFTDDQVKKLIKKWGFGVKNYWNESDYTRKDDLFELAKCLTQYLHISNYEDSGSAIVAIKTKFASYGGYARLYRLLAVAMGIVDYNIFVASDGKNHYWNYVLVENMWYNVDVTSFPFRRYTSYYQTEWQKPFFLSIDALLEVRSDKISTKPSEWVVLYTNYGYPDELESDQEVSENFDDFINIYRNGHRI